MNLIFGVGLVLITANIGCAKAVGKISDNFFDFYSALKFPNEVTTKKLDTFPFKNTKSKQNIENLLPEIKQNFTKNDKNTGFTPEKNKRFLNLTFFILVF